MGHPHEALSAVGVRNEKRPGRYADGHGLYLVVDESGAKRWLLRITVRGKRTDIGLGGLASVPLAKARKDAAAMREMAHAGGDPLAARREAKRGVPTFENAARTVHADHAPSWRNVKHRAQWINTLTEYVFPAIGAKRIDTIGTADVLRVLSPIWLAKPETARRVRQRIGSVMDWAKAAGHYKGENPVVMVTKGLPKQRDKKRHHAALGYLDVPAFVATLRASDSAAVTKRAAEFTILTAARVGEVVGAQRSEFDLDANEWTVPGSRMKAKEPHRVPLSPRAVELLEESFAASESPFAFPGFAEGKPLSSMAFLMLLRRMKVEATAHVDRSRLATAHGFRSAFRTWAAEATAYPREVAELALAHVNKDRVEAAYQRSDLFLKRRRMMDEWAAFVTTAPAATAKKVAPIKAAA